MTTTEKLQGNELNRALRELITLYKEVKEEVDNKPWTEICNNISKVFMHITYEITSENSVLVSYKNNGHTYQVFAHKYFGDFDNKTPDYSLVTTFDSMIDGEVYSIDWAFDQLDGDLTRAQQIEFFKKWDLAPLENFITKDLGANVVLTGDTVTKSKPCCYIHSINDLVEFSGICKAMFKSLKIESFGSCTFYIDEETGKMELGVPDMSFQYEHIDGGHNEHSIYYVKYNYRENKWFIKRPNEDKYFEI